MTKRPSSYTDYRDLLHRGGSPISAAGGIWAGGGGGGGGGVHWDGSRVIDVEPSNNLQPKIQTVHSTCKCKYLTALGGCPAVPACLSKPNLQAKIPTVHNIQCILYILLFPTTCDKRSKPCNATLQPALPTCSWGQLVRKQMEDICSTRPWPPSHHHHTMTPSHYDHDTMTPPSQIIEPSETIKWCKIFSTASHI